MVIKQQNVILCPSRARKASLFPKHLYISCNFAHISQLALHIKGCPGFEAALLIALVALVALVALIALIALVALGPLLLPDDNVHQPARHCYHFNDSITPQQCSDLGILHHGLLGLCLVES